MSISAHKFSSLQEGKFPYIAYLPLSENMDRQILIQYTDLVKEEKEIKQRIAGLEKEISYLERKCLEVDNIADVVKGGEGGKQRFSVEGASQEKQRLKSELLIKKMLLSQRSALLTTLEFEILEKANEVAEYIASIDNSYMRRLLSFRVIDGLKWEQIAIKMGGNNTEDSVKKAFYRFIK